MAENLDDGELWLPSNIFSDLGLLQQHEDHHCPNHHRLLPSSAFSTTGGGDVYDITRHLDALRLLHFSSTNNQLHYSFSKPHHASGNPNLFPANSSPTSSPPVQTTPSANRGLVYSHLLQNPTQIQVDSYLAARARVLEQQKQKQQQKMLQNMVRAGPNRYFASVISPAMSSIGRECSGTGVFLPRVPVSASDNNFDKKKNKPTAAAATMKNSAEQQKQPRKAAGVNASRQRMLYQPLLSEQEMSELLLPPDWTY